MFKLNSNSKKEYYATVMQITSNMIRKLCLSSIQIKTLILYRIWAAYHYKNKKSCNVGKWPYNYSSFKILWQWHFQPNHMKNEEKLHILNIYYKYYDINYKENQPISFTNEFKHKIVTADKITAHTKSYPFDLYIKLKLGGQ